MFQKEAYQFSWWLISVCFLTILIKLSLFLYTNYKAKQYQNLLIRANSLDHRNDCILTTGTLIACLCGLYQIYWVDSLVGIVISIWILISGLHIFYDAYCVLMDRAIDPESMREVLQVVEKHPEVLKVTHFNSTPVGYQYQVNLTIFVDGNMSTFESHEIANTIEKELMKFDMISLAVIHVNPMHVKKKKKIKR